VHSAGNDAWNAFAEVLRISVSAGARCKKGIILGRNNPIYCCIFGAESCQQLHCAVAAQRLNECHPRRFLFMRYLLCRQRLGMPYYYVFEFGSAPHHIYTVTYNAVEIGLAKYILAPKQRNAIQ
jgi:hypothetical protein